MRATIRTILLGATCAIALSACGTIGGTAPHMGRIEAMQDKTTLATPVKVPEPLPANVNETKRSLTTVARLAAATNPAVKEARFGFASQSLSPAQAGLVYLPTLGLSGQVSCRAIWQLTAHAMASAEQWETLDDAAVCGAVARATGFMTCLQRRAHRTADRLAGRLLAAETPGSFAEDAEVMRGILSDRIERGVIDRDRVRSIADQVVAGTPVMNRPQDL